MLLEHHISDLFFLIFSWLKRKWRVILQRRLQRHTEVKKKKRLLPSPAEPLTVIAAPWIVVFFALSGFQLIWLLCLSFPFYCLLLCPPAPPQNNESTSQDQMLCRSPEVPVSAHKSLQHFICSFAMKYMLKRRRADKAIFLVYVQSAIRHFGELSQV